MTLSLEQLATLAHGVSYTTIENERLVLHRLTAEQEDFLRITDPSRLLRASCPAGITLEFTTESTTLTLSALLGAFIGRSHYCFSVFVNGERMDGITVIDCYHAIPHEQRYFTDVVHPNEEGHQYYFDFLCKYL